MLHLKSIRSYPYPFPVYSILHTCTVSTATNSSSLSSHVMTTRLQTIHASLLIRPFEERFAQCLHSEGMLCISWLKQRCTCKSINQASCLLPTMFQWATPPFSMRLSKAFQKRHKSFTKNPQSYYY